MQRPLQTLLAATIAVMLGPAIGHAGYVTAGPILGGDLSYLNSPWGTGAFVFTERVGTQITYMVTKDAGVGFTINMKGPRAYDTSPFLQILDSSSESLQYISVAVSPHAYIQLSGRPGEPQHGLRLSLGLTWSRWSETDTDIPTCFSGINVEQRTTGCPTTVTNHAATDFLGFVVRAQHLYLHPLGCRSAIGGGPYYELEGPVWNGSLGLVFEIMFNSDDHECTSESLNGE